MTPMAERKPLPVSPREVRLQNGLSPVPAAAVLPGDAGERAPGLVVAGRVGSRASVEPTGVAVDDVGIDLAE